MTQQGTGNVKQTLPYPGNVAQAKSRKSKWVKVKGNPNTYSKEEVLEREIERHNHSGRLGLYSTKHRPLWACVFLLASLPFLLMPRGSHPYSTHPCSKHVHATNKESSQQTSKGENKEVKGACKETH